jgi:hypothetical protein
MKSNIRNRAAVLALGAVLFPLAASAAPSPAASTRDPAFAAAPAALKAAVRSALARDFPSGAQDPMRPTQTIVSSDGAGGDQFAWTFAFSGTTALVAAPYADIGGNVDQGAVYVFTLAGGAWTETQKLVASDGATEGIFGYAVALDGSTAVIGSSYATIGANAGQGAAYVFTESGGTWTETQKLIADDGNADEEFGTRVAISGTHILVGSPHANVNGVPRQGAVYAFESDGSTWTQTQKLVSSNGDFFNFFGYSIALQGQAALIGAPDIDTNGIEDQGAVYAFAENGGVWTETQILINDDGAANDNFGYAVAMSGTTAIIGANFARIDGNAEQGSAYVFENAGGTWTQQQKLVSSDSGPGHDFGSAVTFDGDTAAIGAPGFGTAYVFTNEAGAWTETQRLTTGAAGDGFGFSTLLHGSTLLVGAAASNVGGNTMQGKGYFYTNAPDTSPVLDLSPASLAFDVEAGASTSATLTIANGGADPLTYAFSEAAPRVELAPHATEKRAATKRSSVALSHSGRAMPRAVAPWAPRTPDGDLSFVLDDGTYEDSIGLNGPSGESAAIWLNRFTPAPGTGSFTIDSISILWPNNGDNTLIGKQVDLLAYYDADGDGDPSNAVRLGADAFVTIAGIDAFETYTVNFAVPGSGDIYIGFENTYALGITTPVLFPAALDQDSGSQQRSWVAGMSSAADPDPDDLANNDLFGLIDDFGAAGNFLIRGTGTGASGGASCALPSDVPWLSEDPVKGSVAGGASEDVTIGVDAGALAAGEYAALLCVATNDPHRPRAEVPVSVTVHENATDVVFRDGFDGTR